MSDGAMNASLAAMVIAAMGFLLLPACDKAAPTTQGNPPTTSASGAAPMPAAATTGSPSCALVPVAEVSALIGIASLKEPEKGGEPPVTVCNFSDGRNPLAVSVRYETGRDPATFAVIRKGHDDNEQRTSDFPGLTSGAFSFGLGKMHGVSFLHKNTVVMVVAIAPLDKVAALARVVMDRM
jgi:hypothetical protein